MSAGETGRDRLRRTIPERARSAQSLLATLATIAGEIERLQGQINRLEGELAQLAGRSR